MYPELDGIEYVTYIRNDGKSFLDGYDNFVGGAYLDRKSTVPNTGEPWYLAAYGNIKLHLKQKVAEKLYLFSKEDYLRMLSDIEFRKNRDAESQRTNFEKYATKVITQ